MKKILAIILAFVILVGGIAGFVIISKNSHGSDTINTDQPSYMSQDENETTDDISVKDNGYRITLKPYSFNPMGQLINKIVFNTPETIPQPWTAANAMVEPSHLYYYWIYNSSDQVIGCYSVSYDTIMQSNTFEYNDNCEIIKQTTRQGQTGRDLGWNYEYEYNGELLTKVIQTYNGISYGALVEGEVVESVFSYEGNKLSHIISTYYMGNNTRIKHDDFTYNQSGDCIKITWYYEDLDDFKHNEDFEYENGILASVNGITFDKNGNPIHEASIPFSYSKSSLCLKSSRSS